MTASRNRTSWNVGEANPSAKLTADQVMTIRLLHVPRCRKFGTLAFARKYGVSIMTIQRVVHENQWTRH